MLSFTPLECRAEKQLPTKRSQVSSGPPKDACLIWTDGAFIHLSMPSPTRDGKAHTVTLPLERCAVDADEVTKIGWYQLRHILWSRFESRSKTKNDFDHRRIGGKGAPVQYDLEKISRVLRKKTNALPTLTIEDLFDDKQKG